MQEEDSLLLPQVCEDTIDHGTSVCDPSHRPLSVSSLLTWLSAWVASADSAACAAMLSRRLLAGVASFAPCQVWRR